MADIQTYLQQILSAVYGKDVRQSIHDAIQKCYEDGKSGSVDLTARKQIECLSNQNLLINGDFRSPINQRGKSTYEGQTEKVYTIDRWCMGEQNYGRTVEVKDSGIKIANSNTSYVGTFKQIFEKTLPLGTYTVSVNVLEINGGATISCGGSQESTRQKLNVGVNTLTLTNTTIESVQILVAVESDITIEWIKLEQGSIATPFVPKPHGEELMECYRFYYTFDSRLLIGVYSGSFADGNLYFPIKMRVTPKLEYYECTYFDPVSNNFLTPEKVELSTSYCNEKSVTIKFTKNSSSTFNVGQAFNAKVKLCFTAEIE